MSSIRHCLAQSLLVAASVATTFGPQHVLALPETQVSEKLDTIFMLMAVVDKGVPAAGKATIDNKQIDAYLAAISIADAE